MVMLCYCYGCCISRERRSITAAEPTGRDALLRAAVPTGRDALLRAAVPTARDALLRPLSQPGETLYYGRCASQERRNVSAVLTAPPILPSSSGLLACAFSTLGSANTEQEDNQRCEQDQLYNGRSQKDEQQYADKSTNMIGDLDSLLFRDW